MSCIQAAFGLASSTKLRKNHLNQGMTRWLTLKLDRWLTFERKFQYGACSYWHYDIEGRTAADKMISAGWLTPDDHLLSKAEREYFSYYTDNAEFTNGFAYRNHYAHGNTPPNTAENAHAKAYFVMLRLLTILILKIYDDLFLARKALVIDISSIDGTDSKLLDSM